MKNILRNKLLNKMRQFKRKLAQTQGKMKADSDSDSNDDSWGDFECRYKEITMILHEDTWTMNKHFLNMIAEPKTLEVADVLYDNNGDMIDTYGSHIIQDDDEDTQPYEIPDEQKEEEEEKESKPAESKRVRFKAPRRVGR